MTQVNWIILAIQTTGVYKSKLDLSLLMLSDGKKKLLEQAQSPYKPDHLALTLKASIRCE